MPSSDTVCNDDAHYKAPPSYLYAAKGTPVHFMGGVKPAGMPSSARTVAHARGGAAPSAPCPHLPA